MANYDWDKIETEAGGNFSPMAEVGKHTAKVETIDVRETKNAQGNTTYWMDFIFTDEGTRFPKISHAISFKNQGWRMVHFMRVLKELGIPEDKAKAAIEQAEGKKGEANIVAAYHAMFDRATQKHPEVEIDVFEDEKINPNTGRPYKRADFANPAISFGRSDKKQAPVKQESILDEGETVDLTDESLPF